MRYQGDPCKEVVDPIQRKAVKTAELIERDLRNILHGHDEMAIHHEVVIMSRRHYEQIRKQARQ